MGVLKTTQGFFFYPPLCFFIMLAIFIFYSFGENSDANLVCEGTFLVMYAAGSFDGKAVKMKGKGGLM